MAQFNASKNPPWVRSDNFPVPQMTQPAIHQQILAPQMAPVVQYQQNPGQQTATVYQAQLALQQQALTMQQNLQQISNTQIYNPQINAVATAVGTRNLNAAAFAQPVVATTSAPPAPQVSNIAPTTTGTKQRVFTGIVTKVLDTYGFVDDDVFFQLSVVKGPPPVINDRVLVEAVCLPNMPFKWNATRIQVLPMNDAPRNNKKGFIVSTTTPVDRGNYTNAPSLGDYDETRRDRDRDRDRRRRRSRERNRNRSPLSVQDEERRRKEQHRDRDDKDKEKERERERERTRSRSVKKSTSRQQAVKKYRVRVPEFPLDVSHMSVSDLRTRYHTMYVPSDFFRTSLKWQEMFPPQQIEFSKNAQFHVMSKEVDRICDFPDDLEPPDADYLFSAKVMLMSVPLKDVMMKKCLQLSEDLEKDDGKNLVHPSRLINCLVGVNTRTKNEIMAIGGPWSPSLDGTDPAGDANVLIKTAIRTCRALTGIDLTPCTHWYRFVEIYYHRPKSTHKGKQIPARVETVVIYVPDVWSVMPSCLEWDGLQFNMKKQLNSKLIEAGKEQVEVAPDDEKMECVTSSQKEPTHYSQLDPKVMKVSELRDELEVRNMSAKGLRLQLLARLTKVLKTEQEVAEQEEKNAEKAVGEKEKEKEEEEKKMKLEKEKKKAEHKNRVLVEERYALPETPHILVFPSKLAKNGKFSCKVMSLSLLLDYSADISKEHTFEVSLFAELFNEMLMWDFGMQVYRAIHDAPDVEEIDEPDKKDEKKDKEKKGEKGKDEREDKSPVREKSGEPSEEKTEKVERQNVVNGNEREPSQESSDGDDSQSRDSSINRRDRRDDRRDRKKKESVPHYTAYPELLLAFTYFDVTRYGSISKSHLEDLIHTLGLQLSRAQVKRLVGKVTYRDYCDYRRLTDLPVGTNRPDESTVQESLPSVDLGNKAHLPIFQMPTSGPKVENSSPPCKRSKRLLEKESNADKNSEGYLYYRSVLVNVDNLKEQVTRNETARLKTEEKLTELRKELEEMREKSKRSDDEVRTLEKELRSCRSKLALTTEKLSEQVASSDIYLSALMDIEERLIPILDTDEIKRLITKRQSIIGAPSINLVPLTKVEDITVLDDSEKLSQNVPELIKTESVESNEAEVKQNPNEEDIKMEV